MVQDAVAACLHGVRLDYDGPLWVAAPASVRQANALYKAAHGLELRNAAANDGPLHPIGRDDTAAWKQPSRVEFVGRLGTVLVDLVDPTMVDFRLRWRRADWIAGVRVLGLDDLLSSTRQYSTLWESLRAIRDERQREARALKQYRREAIWAGVSWRRSSPRSCS